KDFSRYDSKEKYPCLSLPGRKQREKRSNYSALKICKDLHQTPDLQFPHSLISLPIFDDKHQKGRKSMADRMSEHHASVTVNAPVHQVYSLFSHFNDFP